MTTCGCYWCSEGMTDRSAMGILLDYILYLENEMSDLYSSQGYYSHSPTQTRFDFVYQEGEGLLPQALQHALDADGFHHYGFDWDADEHQGRINQVEQYNAELNKTLERFDASNRELMEDV